MKYKEICERYSMEMNLLQDIVSSGLLDGTKDFTDVEIQKLSKIMSLFHAGLHLQEIKSILRFEKNSDSKGEYLVSILGILNLNRKEQLGWMHQYQQQIDRLDYMINDYASQLKETTKGGK